MMSSFVWHDEELSLMKGFNNPVYTYMLQQLLATRTSPCSQLRQKKNTMDNLNDESIILIAFKH